MIFFKRIRLGAAGPGRPDIEPDPIKQRLVRMPIYIF